MSETATCRSVSTLRIRSENATWMSGTIVDDEYLLLDSESAAVGLREMTLSEEAVQQLSDVLQRPSRSTVVPRDLPSV